MPVVLVAAVLCLTSCVSMSQGIVFSETTHDFGRALQNRRLTCVFQYENLTRDTITLGEPRTSCTCTAALLTNGIVPPKGSGSLSVEFFPPHGINGPVSKTITIDQKKGTERLPALTLRVQAHAEAELIPEPESVRLDIEEGNTAETTLMLRSNSRDTIAIGVHSAAFMQYADATDAKSTGSSITEKPFTDFEVSMSDDPIPPGSKKALRLTMRGTVKSRISGSIRLVLPNSELRVPVTADVRRIRSPGG